MREETARLLARYAGGSLAADERRGLFAEALDDQEVFDALCAEDAITEVLEHADTRHLVDAELAHARPRGLFASWWSQPLLTRLVFTGLPAAAAILCAVVLYYRAGPTPGTAGGAIPAESTAAGANTPGEQAGRAGQSPTSDFSRQVSEAMARGGWLAGWIARSAKPSDDRDVLDVDASGDEPLYQPGEPVRISVTPTESGVGVLFDVDEEARALQLWPAPPERWEHMTMGSAFDVGGEGAPVKPTQAGLHRLRLVIAEDEGLLSSASALTAAVESGRARVVERRYRVSP